SKPRGDTSANQNDGKRRRNKNPYTGLNRRESQFMPSALLGGLLLASLLRYQLRRFTFSGEFSLLGRSRRVSARCSPACSRLCCSGYRLRRFTFSGEFSLLGTSRRVRAKMRRDPCSL